MLDLVGPVKPKHHQIGCSINLTLTGQKFCGIVEIA